MPCGNQNMSKPDVRTKQRVLGPTGDRRIYPKTFCYEYYHDKSFVTQILQFNLQPYLDEERPVFPRGVGAAYEVRRLLNIYRQWKSLKSYWEHVWLDKHFEDVVVYCMAFLCYCWQVQNSFVVSDVLMDIYHCYGNFMPLFQQSMSHPRTVMDVWNSTCYRPFEIKNIPPFTYFVFHATQAKLCFREIHFVDWRLKHPNSYRPSPVYLAASLGEMDLLMYLLKYGARLNQPTCLRVPSWVTCLIVKLLSTALRAGILENLSKMKNRSSDLIPVQGQLEILCVRILLRAIPQMNISEFRFLRNNYWRKYFLNPEEFVCEMSDNGLVPKLKYRFLLPPELKHSCRVVIRECLRLNWQLPDGINHLQIPQTLTVYLDLEED